MTKKEKHNLLNSVYKIRNTIYDLQADVDSGEWVTPYARKCISEVDKLIYILNNDTKRKDN